MKLPDYWLMRPDIDLEIHRKAFEHALQIALETGTPTLPPNVPIWNFLCWLCDEGSYVAHGTGRNDIAIFEPRQSNDVGWFGNRKAVYAASDGLWAMFFAIMNRPEVAMTIVNGAVRIDCGDHLKPFYFFGASRHAVTGRAYRRGWVYLLPSEGFDVEPGGERYGYHYETCHCANLNHVKPAFKVAVQPKDFPFLERIHAYDEEDLAARVREDPNGFPWIE
jgi:hypothetical protein